MTLAGSISLALYNGWGLAGAGAKENIAFGTVKDWYDPLYASKPQITVSDLVEPNGRFFLNVGGTLIVHSYPRYVVNVWVPVPVGVKGSSEKQLAEDLKNEAARVILANRNSIADFDPIVPMDLGVPLHEVNGEPRLLRYEITLIGAHDKIQG